MPFYGLWDDKRKRWFWAMGSVFHTPHKNIAMAQLDHVQAQRRELGLILEDCSYTMKVIGPDGRPAEDE